MFFNESTHAAVSSALSSAMLCKNFRKFDVACSKPTNIDGEACNNISEAVNKLAISARSGHSCWWFSPGTPVSSTNKTHCHDITEILLKVALSTINQSNQWIKRCKFINDFDCIATMFESIYLFYIAKSFKILDKK